MSEQAEGQTSTMLTVINLFVIDRIFSEVASKKLSAMAKMVYINCLMHHFRDKPAVVSSSVAFEIFESDFGDFEKYRRHVQELHKAGLVTIGHKVIHFENTWGAFIDRSKLGKVSAEMFVAGMRFEKAGKYKQELLNSQELFELSAMQHKIGKAQFEKLIELFVKQQDTFEKKYPNFGDCKKHFSFWLRSNTESVSKETVKSNSKILGKE